jgi:hypothetical protein
MCRAALHALPVLGEALLVLKRLNGAELPQFVYVLKSTSAKICMTLCGVQNAKIDFDAVQRNCPVGGGWQQM